MVFLTTDSFILKKSFFNKFKKLDFSYHSINRNNDFIFLTRIRTSVSFLLVKKFTKYQLVSNKNVFANTQRWLKFYKLSTQRRVHINNANTQHLHYNADTQHPRFIFLTMQIHNICITMQIHNIHITFFSTKQIHNICFTMQIHNIHIVFLQCKIHNILHYKCRYTTSTFFWRGLEPASLFLLDKS